jgi:hypothetical protein
MKTNIAIQIKFSGKTSSTVTQANPMSNKTTLLLSSLFVVFVAIANLIRMLWDISLSIGPIYLPGWTGAIAYFLLGLLALWSFRSLTILYDPYQEPPSDL